MTLFDDQADEGDDLAQARQGWVVGHAVPVFVKAAHAGPDAQDRPTAADQVEVQGRQRRLKRTPGKGQRHPGAEFQPLGSARCGGQGEKRRAGQLNAPQPVQPQLFGTCGRVKNLGRRLRRQNTPISLAVDRHPALLSCLLVDALMASGGRNRKPCSPPQPFTLTGEAVKLAGAEEQHGFQLHPRRGSLSSGSPDLAAGQFTRGLRPAAL